MMRYFLLLFFIFNSSAFAGSSILQATLTITSAVGEGADALRPGTPATLKALIKNTGDAPNHPAHISIRFALPKPIAHLGKTPLFETEKEPLPPIQPGQTLEIVFNTLQQLPSLIDFLKNDWPMHLYEAVVYSKSGQYIIGTGAITFSAHYYQGPTKPHPTAIP